MPNRVEKFREASGLSRAEVAERLGVHERTVLRWETEETGIPDERKQQLAELFGGVKVAYLMGWEHPPEKAPA